MICMWFILEINLSPSHYPRFSSAPFLWRLHINGVFISGCTYIVLVEFCLPISLASFSAKIKHAFWISTYNFVFPVLLSVAQIVSYMASNDYVLAMYIEQVNIYFTIIGLVFATVWAAERHWEDAQRRERSRPSQMSTICFVPAHPHTESGGAVTLAKPLTQVPSEPGSYIPDSSFLILESAQHERYEFGIAV